MKYISSFYKMFDIHGLVVYCSTVNLIPTEEKIFYVPFLDAGRALEEVRASLFSKLREFGGGKRQQTTLWGPTVALTFNFFVSVSIILMNKLVSLLNLNLTESRYYTF